MEKSKVAQLRYDYPSGTMVRLIEMPDDPYPIEPGTFGRVEMVDILAT